VQLKRRIDELVRWFTNQDRQILFLERERQKLSALVNHTDAGFLVIDKSLSVTWRNKVALENFCAGHSTTLKCNSLCGSPTLCEECPAVRAFRTDSVAHAELRLDVKGETRQVYASAIPIRSAKGDTDEAMLMLQDITDLGVLRKSLQEKEAAEREAHVAREIAEAASRSKSAFLASMSHEIRTPMSGVIGMADLLLETELDDEQRVFVEMIQRSGSSLLAIINDILDLSKIEAGRLDLDLHPFELRTLVREVVDLLKIQAEDKGISIEVHLDESLPNRVVGDSGRIRQVLLNLVGNAIKFTHDGGVTMRVSLDAEEGDLVTLTFSVEDTGIGIEAGQLQRVFEKFTQADASTTRKYGGTGLGLSICKQLVSLMQGTLSGASQIDHGSAFSFTLTLPVDGRTADQEDPASLRASASVAHRALVVDDSKVNQIVAQKLLEALGCAVDVADNGRVALDLIENAQYDLILMDCEMPEMDGYQTAREIRRLEQGSGARLLILAMTANNMEGDRDRCVQAGMDGYATKPVQKDALRDLIAKHLGHIVSV